MLSARLIPCLLLKGQGLVKTVRFKDPTYVGDPINAVKLFNDLEVDELVLLDITATREDREPPFERIEEIVSEAFMPICYGGGVTSFEHAQRLFGLGVEKVAVTTAAVERPELIEEMAGAFGSQSVIVGIDVKRNWRGKPKVFTRSGTRDTGLDPVALAKAAAERGAGEILVNAIDRDGVGGGYDLPLIAELSAAVGVPVVACGGAGSLADARKAIDAGASAAAAGSLFVFKGPHRAVLINYPTQAELRTMLAAPV
ncbi:MAG TPA: AglZ/HisF2 family acetamidino modification protein [Caulobacteraceae bacterium]